MKDAETFVPSTTNDRIRWRAKVLGLTMKAVADRAGVNYRSLQNYVSGANRMPADIVPGLAVALGTGSDWLLTGKAPATLPDLMAEALSYADRLRARHEFDSARLASIVGDFYELRYVDQMLAGRPIA
jgi:transcriptional regulator with XRE-family HTH domain